MPTSSMNRRRGEKNLQQGSRRRGEDKSEVNVWGRGLLISEKRRK